MVDVYRDDAGEWRWRIKADNGKIVADCSEGYVNLADCLHGYQVAVTIAVTDALVVDNRIRLLELQRAEPAPEQD